MGNNLRTRQIARRFLAALVLIVTGMAILFLRNPDPILNPVVYAEDGAWAALGLREGWLQAFMLARPDYFVAVNILLLFIATKISWILSGNPLSLLAYSIAFVSYAFYAGVATLSFFTIRRVGNIFFALLAFLLFLHLPLGDTQNEIIGRVAQVGFFMPLVAMMLLFWRDTAMSGWVKYFIDACLLLCAATNPVVFALVFLYLVINFSRDVDFLACARRTVSLTVPFALFAAVLSQRIGGPGGVPGELVSSNLVEATLARPLLYPFTFPWYSHLNDAVAIAASLLIACVVVVSYRNSRDTQSRHLLTLASITIVAYDVATMVTRPGLTGLLSNYQTSFPDRYFMGINALTSFLAVVCISQLWYAGRWKALSLVLTIFTVGLYFLSPRFIFETNGARLPIKGALTFSEQICVSVVPEEGKNVWIQIYPDQPNWRVSVPRRYIDKRACRIRSYKDAGIARPAETPTMRPSPPLSAASPIQLSMTSDHRKKNRSLRRIGVMMGTYARANPGEAELRLQGKEGVSIARVFSISDLTDNAYRYFDVDTNQYTKGEIVFKSGGGISTWEFHDERTGPKTCIKYEYADGGRGLTAGCP